MKRLLLLLALLPLGLQAQDSAEVVVGRYLKLLCYDSLPKDSTLVMETTISFHGSNDTFTMRRWFTPPSMMRLEVWHDDALQTGLCTNGSNRYREFIRRMDWWEDVKPEEFQSKMEAYDFRGGLFNWQARGIQLEYRGVVLFKGQRLQVVRAKQKDHFTRYYMFEEQSGLLVLVQEKDEDDDNTNIDLKPLHVKPMEYKVFHEYMPLGGSLVVRQESFMREGVLTVMETRAHFEPRTPLLFNQD